MRQVQRNGDNERGVMVYEALDGLTRWLGGQVVREEPRWCLKGREGGRGKGLAD